MNKCWSEDCEMAVLHMGEVDQTATVELNAYEPWLPVRIEEQLQASVITQITASGRESPSMRIKPIHLAAGYEQAMIHELSGFSRWAKTQRSES